MQEKIFFAGEISAEQLREVETQEIRRIVDKQIEIGLETVTDGEFRRTWWHLDFLEHLNGMEGYVPNNGGQNFARSKKQKDIMFVISERFHSILIIHLFKILLNLTKS